MRGGERAVISVGRRSSTSSDLSLQDLEDDLLIEILSRTPTTRFAFRCKLVSKRWCSLISSPYFGSRFVDIHVELDDDENSEYQQNLGMLATHLHPAKDNCMVSVASKNPTFNFPGFNLGFLPEERESVIVVASCNDLILCQAGKKRENKSYYLCNPFTMQWVALPPPSLVPQISGHHTTFGLVCESYCQRGCQGGRIADFESRYRVVRFYYQEGIRKHAKQLRFCSETEIPQMADRFMVETYHSESGIWIQSELLGREYRFSSQIVAYNGKLHWISLCGRHFVTYDPFNMGKTSLIVGPHFNLSSQERQRLCRFHVGECKGVLRVMRMRLGYECCLVSGSFPLVSKDLSVWDLESDQMGRRLSLRHNATFDTIVSNNPWTRVISRPCAGDLAFHPRNEDVLYLWYSESGKLLVSYNMESGVLKVEGRFKSSTCYPNCCEVFPLVLPLWPTPILSSTTSSFFKD